MLWISAEHAIIPDGAPTSWLPGNWQKKLTQLFVLRRLSSGNSGKKALNSLG